ncbi:MAG: hypothetical protein ACM3O3_12900 [Syntrophothermus sp.]
MNKVSLEKKPKEVVSGVVEKKELTINDLKFNQLSHNQKMSIAFCIMKWVEEKLPEGFESLEIVKHPGSIMEEREEFKLRRKSKENKAS